MSLLLIDDNQYRLAQGALLLMQPAQASQLTAATLKQPQALSLRHLQVQ